MEKRYKLELIGITYNQIETGVYALILQQENSNRRIPIIIGAPEAQAIECKLQEVKTPRPLTHDMTASIITSFKLTLKEIEIRRLANGVFAAYLIMTDGIETHKIDARSSDAIALAIRVGAPIYTTKKVLEEAGFYSDSEIPHQRGDKDEPIPDVFDPDNFELMSEKDLEIEMQKAVDCENYERAALIKEELKKRKETE